MAKYKPPVEAVEVPAKKSFTVKLYSAPTLVVEAFDRDEAWKVYMGLAGLLGTTNTPEIIENGNGG